MPKAAAQVREHVNVGKKFGESFSVAGTSRHFDSPVTRENLT